MAKAAENGQTELLLANREIEDLRGIADLQKKSCPGQRELFGTKKREVKCGRKLRKNQRNRT